MLRAYCLSKKWTSEDLPFDEETLVVKVGNKIFGLFSSLELEFINLKCDPEKSLELRDSYPDSILPGYHMNKKHWNSVYPNRELSDQEVFKLIDHSYDLVYKSLAKKVREQLLDDEN